MSPGFNVTVVLRLADEGESIRSGKFGILRSKRARAK